MINKSIDHWKYDDSMRNLSLFASLIDEMTFNYTIDTFKAPALNVMSLIDEATSVINEINKGVIMEGSFQSVIDELRFSIEKDTIFKEVMVQKGLYYLVEGLNTTNNLKQLLNVLELFDTFNLHIDYVSALKNGISEIVKNNNKKRGKLEEYARLFVTQMRNEGYSDEHIYYTNQTFFFNKTHVIDAAAKIDDFFDLFDLNIKEYNVYYIGNPFYVNLSDPFTSKGIEVQKQLDVDTKNPDVVLFDKQASKNSVYIKVRQQAKDIYSARTLSIEQIMEVTRFFSFFNHKGTLPIRENCLVVDMYDNTYSCVRPPIPNIVRCKDHN